MVCPTQEAEEDGIFVGLLPRGSVSPEDGFYAWDIGFLWLSPDCLVWLGVAVLQYFVVNTGSVSLIVAAAEGLPFQHVWMLGPQRFQPCCPRFLEQHDRLMGVAQAQQRLSQPML